jgi:acyl-CoA thioesterase 8
MHVVNNWQEGDIYTNVHELPYPPNERGIFGGAIIAQCLSVAQRTVTTFLRAHSMHCYFVRAGRSGTPVLYHVEQYPSPDDVSSPTVRTVQARQLGECICTVTVCFVREFSDENDGEVTAEDAARMLSNALELKEKEEVSGNNPASWDAAFHIRRLKTENGIESILTVVIYDRMDLP